MKPQRPALRYHGGKWKLAEWILGHFPHHRTYVEPYGGGASVLLRKHRSPGEVYNDLDDQVVNVFRVLRDPALAEQLRAAVALTPFARTEFLGSYEPAGDVVESARRLIVRGFLGYGSTGATRVPRTGFRFGANRRGTMPALDWARWPQEIPLFVERLRAVVIENRPALDVIRQHDAPGTLFYCDPPYPHSTRTSIKEGKEYYRHELDDDAHRDLASVLKGVSGMAVVSGYGCELYDRELYPDWTRFDRRALAFGGKDRTEVLWLNDAAARRLMRPSLLPWEGGAPC